MNNAIFLWAITAFILFVGCYPTRNTPLITNDLCCTATEVTDSMYLSKRIPDCDMAIKYMDSVIQKGLIYYDASRVVPNILEGRFSVFCDSTDLYKSKKCFYYINTVCFEGRSCNDFFRVFCPDSSSEIFKILKSESFRREREIRIYLFSNSDFDIIVDLEKGIIKKIDFTQRKIIESN